VIGYLKGQLKEAGLEAALILINGVGYEVLGSQTLLADLVTRVNQEIEVWIYTHVREDALQLFGFASPDEKQLFLSLLKVNGVGPKSALNLLSGGSVNDIIGMIESEDAKGLSKLPKVGKKTAEQIILTLKGKLVLTEKTSKATQLSLPKSASDIRSALINLGFKPNDVEKIIHHLPEGIDFEQGLRQGLAALTGGI
jgi:Holliday junction DNA helicase RuvA